MQSKYFNTLESIRAKYGNFEQRYAEKNREKRAWEIYQNAKTGRIEAGESDNWSLTEFE